MACHTGRYCCHNTVIVCSHRAKLLASPTFHRLVEKAQKRVRQLKHGPDPEDMGGTNIQSQSHHWGSGYDYSDTTCNLQKQVNKARNTLITTWKSSRISSAAAQAPRNRPHCTNQRLRRHQRYQRWSICKSITCINCTYYGIRTCLVKAIFRAPFQTHLQATDKNWASWPTFNATWLSFHPKIQRHRIFEAIILYRIRLRILSRCRHAHTCFGHQ